LIFHFAGHHNPVSAESNDNIDINVVPEIEPPRHDNVGVNDVPKIELLGHDNVGVNVVPKTGKGHKKHGRPRKNKDVMGINEVVKHLLSDFEYTNGKDEDLFYDSDEMRKEREETAHWWDNFEFNVNKGVGVGDHQADDVNESDGLASLGD
jgi:hypothetical protein